MRCEAAGKLLLGCYFDGVVSAQRGDGIEDRVLADALIAVHDNRGARQFFRALHGVSKVRPEPIEQGLGLLAHAVPGQVDQLVVTAALSGLYAPASPGVDEVCAAAVRNAGWQRPELNALVALATYRSLPNREGGYPPTLVAIPANVREFDAGVSVGAQYVGIAGA